MVLKRIRRSAADVAKISKLRDRLEKLINREIDTDRSGQFIRSIKNCK